MTYIKCTINISNNIQDNTKGIHSTFFILFNILFILLIEFTIQVQSYGDTNILFTLKLPISL